MHFDFPFSKKKKDAEEKQVELPKIKTLTFYLTNGINWKFQGYAPVKETKTAYKIELANGEKATILKQFVTSYVEDRLEKPLGN